MKLLKEIVSKNGKVHFRRWNVLTTKWFSIYIHGIYEEDKEQHLHDHPWNFLSIVLQGSYTERLLSKDKKSMIDTKRFPLTFAFRNARRFHKILQLHSKVCYTLIVIGSRSRDWGYWIHDSSTTNGYWVENSKYRKIKNDGGTF